MFPPPLSPLGPLLLLILGLSFGCFADLSQDKQHGLTEVAEQPADPWRRHDLNAQTLF